jgi:hypothetical protein
VEIWNLIAELSVLVEMRYPILANQNAGRVLTKSAAVRRMSI